MEAQARLSTLKELLEKQKVEVKSHLKEAGFKKVSGVDSKIVELEKHLETAVSKAEKLFPGGIETEEDEFEDKEF